MTIPLTDIVDYAEEAFALCAYKFEGEQGFSYTDIGNLVYRLKYCRSSMSDEEIKKMILQLADYLKEYSVDIDLILPVPSFNPLHQYNPSGDFKLMYEVADCLSRLVKKPTNPTILEKKTSAQAKDSILSSSDFSSKSLSSDIKRVLVIDDLFGSGSTAKMVLSAFKETNPTIFIRFISLTKNMYGGIPKKRECRLSRYESPNISANGQEFLVLYFYDGDKSEKVRVWEDSNIYSEIKEAFQEGDYLKTFVLPLKKNRKGYWQFVSEEGDI